MNSSVTTPLARYAARHFRLAVEGKLATVTLDRPEKKNPLTFDSYAELGELFRAAARDDGVKAFVVTGAGGNFCSGGDVFEIIKPLTEMEVKELLQFTRMTGEVVKAMRACPQPIVAAVEGVCAGAGAILAMASDLRVGTPAAKVAFLFNRLAAPDAVLGEAQKLAAELAAGPTFANAMTKRMLEMEWAMSVETAVEAEAVAQALCMETEDFARAFRAFAAKQKPVFEGN